MSILFYNLFFKQIKYYTVFIVLAGFCGFLMLAGCSEVTEKKEEEILFNSVVHDPNFQAMMQSYPIRLIAPASGTNPLKVTKLKSLSFLKLSVSDNLIVNDAAKDVPYHSNVDDLRFEMLREALYNDPETIIWTLRGGYGSTRLIERLQSLPPPKKEKVFIGFSDNTALHLFLSQKWGWKTIHGSGVAGLTNPGVDPDNYLRIARLISDPNYVPYIDHLIAFNEAAKNVKQNIYGKLTGGNISIIQTSLGTDWQIESKNKILFLEEVNEKGYQVDRILNHLKQAGIFKEVKAIVLGDFTDSRDEWVDLALERFAKEMQIPVYKTDEFGHGEKNYPLIYNSMAEIVGDRLVMNR